MAGTTAIIFGGADINVDVDSITVGDIANLANITTSVTPGTATANLGKAEGALPVAGATGIEIFVRRTDVLTALTVANGRFTLFNVNADGALWIERVDGKVRRIETFFTPADAAYSVDDAFGAALTLPTPFRTASGSLILESVILTDTAGLKPKLDIFLFRNTFSSDTPDNDPIAIAPANLINSAGLIDFAVDDWKKVGTPAIAMRSGLKILIQQAGASTPLIAKLVIREIKDYGASDTFRITFQTEER